MKNENNIIQIGSNISSVSISDENGCTVSQSFTLTSPSELAIISTKKDYNGFNVSCNGLSDGEIDIEVSGGYLDPGAVYSYSWTTNNGSGLDTNSEDQTGLSAGSYTVTATDDNGTEYNLTIDNGRIIAASPINSNIVSDLPKITVNGTGTGALIRPLMGPYDPQKEVVSVIDCVS